MGPMSPNPRHEHGDARSRCRIRGDPDVLIAGAGPAGSVAALVLARAGARVQLVDRARFPRTKLCGDTINPGSLSILRRLGLRETVVARSLPIEGMLVTGVGGVGVRARYRRNGTAVEGRAITRRELDALLLAAAIGAGAQFEEGVTVHGPFAHAEESRPRVRGLELRGRGGRTVRQPARITIAADGRRSIVAAALGLTRVPGRPRRWVVGGYFAGVTGLSARGEMHVRRDHYVGVAPVPGGLANVCVVSSLRAPFAHPGSLLAHVLATDPLLRDRFTGAHRVSPVSSMGPLAVDASTAGMPGLLLAGDAAGFIDPITGDGIRFALRGGELAARAALEMLETGRQDGASRLARWRAVEFGSKWRFNRAVRVLVGSPAGVAVGSFGAAVCPWALRRMIAYAGDVPW